MLSLYRAALVLRRRFVEQGDALSVERQGDLLLLRRGAAAAIVNFAAHAADLPPASLPTTAQPILASTAQPVLTSHHAGPGNSQQIPPDSTIWFA
jgi:hypothetical protein